MELFPAVIEARAIRRIDDPDDRVSRFKVVPPVRSETALAANVPFIGIGMSVSSARPLPAQLRTNIDGEAAVDDGADVETESRTHCGHIFAHDASYECRFACIVETAEQRQAESELAAETRRRILSHSRSKRIWRSFRRVFRIMVNRPMPSVLAQRALIGIDSAALFRKLRGIRDSCHRFCRSRGICDKGSRRHAA